MNIPLASFTQDRRSGSLPLPEQTNALMDRLRISSSDAALFFDVDGTLSEIAERPNEAFISNAMLHLLRTLEQSGVPVALVSGRPIVQLDAMTHPYQFAAAGQHGLEMRGWRCRTPVCVARPALLDALAAEIRQWTQGHEGLGVEDKGLSIAVHYRLAPPLEKHVQDMLAGMVRAHGSDLRLQQGKMVCEMRLAGADKGSAILALMESLPATGKIPVFFGDDITDEDGFAAVNRVGGISVKIGEGDTCAQYRAANPGQLQEWLESITISQSGESHG